jgi:3-methyladenine DNA glycosylase AlkD
MLKKIRKILLAESGNKRKASIDKFVPGSQKVYGVSMPLLNGIAKDFKEGGFELVTKLWKSGAFEEKVLAAKLLGKICKKNPELTLEMVTRFSHDITNWAECDALGMQSIKAIARIKQKEIFKLSKHYGKSQNPWERRLSLVLLESYTKDKALKKEILMRIGQLENDEDYYVKKAVTWLKRNYTVGR